MIYQLREIGLDVELEKGDIEAMKTDLDALRGGTDGGLLSDMLFLIKKLLPEKENAKPIPPLKSL